MADRITPADRQEVAALVLRLCEEHAPGLADRLQITWESRFTRRLADATYWPAMAVVASTHRRGLNPGRERCAVARRAGLDPHAELAVLRFSEALWPHASVDERVNTVVHELAHVLVYRRWWASGCAGRKPAPHGAEWRAVHRALGHEPRRCHEVRDPNAPKPAPRAKRPCGLVTCRRCGAQMTVGPGRTAKLRRGVTYTHGADCGGRIILIAFAPNL